MSVWIDLENSPHVPFFAPIIESLHARGVATLVSARNFAQTIELTRLYGVEAVAVGGHGGASLAGKLRATTGRALSLRRFARAGEPRLAVSHNSYTQIAAARLAGIPALTLFDYEHTPANHLAFRLARTVVLPEAIPIAAVRRFGAHPEKVLHYRGFKEQVYLDRFVPAAAEGLDGAVPAEFFRRFVVVVARPPADFALYHRFANPLFERWLDDVGRRPDVRIVVLPRTAEQRGRLETLDLPSVWIPSRAVDGSSLLFHADLVVSAGGTMNREAAVLGTPAVSLFAGTPASVDLELERLGRLRFVRDEAELASISIEKKRGGNRMNSARLCEQLTDTILRNLPEN